MVSTFGQREQLLITTTNVSKIQKLKITLIFKTNNLKPYECYNFTIVFS